ncbi:hypothetical protein Taro_016543 [Colocasia esculenta]|uniref:Expansin n=1 Tax=Colocasia esculenta TaxID=4460 RepID=A0A843UL11_COLES|nr:hypothetical protein [Colocasia esculenta]
MGGHTSRVTKQVRREHCSQKMLSTKAPSPQPAAEGAAGSVIVTVTATNLFLPSIKPSNNGGWCNPPLRHFDNQPAFLKIGQLKAGIVPVLFRRVPCVKSGGIKFEIKGNKYWFSILVYNIGGAGNVHTVAVKWAKIRWIAMWGAKWLVQGQTTLVGQTLSFLVTASNGRTVRSDGVAPASWQFGWMCEGK